jgi:hypothetical protein
MIIATFIYLLALACWLGGIVFFSFFVSPIVFKRLPLGEAGNVLNGLFPLYYKLGYVAGAIAVVLALYFAAYRSPRMYWAGAALTLAISLGLTVWAGAVVRPRIAAVRSVKEEQNPDPARLAEFDSLHHQSVILNGAVLALDLLALASTAAALAHHARS